MQDPARHGDAAPLPEVDLIAQLNTDLQEHLQAAGRLSASIANACMILAQQTAQATKPGMLDLDALEQE